MVDEPLEGVIVPIAGVEFAAKAKTGKSSKQRIIIVAGGNLFNPAWAILCLGIRSFRHRKTDLETTPENVNDFGIA
jgi:hypothetical protein